MIAQSDNSNISPKSSAKMESNKTEESTVSKFGTRLWDVIGSLFGCALFFVIGSWLPMIMPSEKAGVMALIMISADHQGKPFGTDVGLPENSSSITPLRAIMDDNEEVKMKTGLNLLQFHSIAEQPPGFIINSCGIMMRIGNKYLALLRSDYLFDCCIIQFILLILAILSLGEVIVNVWLLLK